MPWDVAAIQPVACAPRVTFFGPVPDVPAAQRSEGELLEVPSASDDSRRVAALRAAGRRATGIPPGMTDVAERKAALAKWHVILSAAFDAGIMHGKKGDLDLLAEEVLECKATATLEARGGSLLLFMAWASRGDEEAFPVREDMVLRCLRHAQTVAATRGTRFLEALGFFGYLFSVEVDHIFTPRARGVALKGLKRKADTRKRSAFPVVFVEYLEKAVVEAASALSTGPRGMDIYRGFLLWTIHSRGRCGDAARVANEPIMDLGPDGDGYIEASAKFGKHKTGYHARKAGLALPFVACARGVSGLPWAEAWLKLRASAGLDAEKDGCLMPEVLCDNSLGIGRLTTGAAGDLLTIVLSESGLLLVGDFGTHSAKATLLSWAAKAALPRAVRRMLGAHADPRDKSMLEYSRDAMAGPMDALRGLLLKIRDKQFMPDSTRSGRWAPKARRQKTAAKGIPGDDLLGREGPDGDVEDNDAESPADGPSPTSTTEPAESDPGDSVAVAPLSPDGSTSEGSASSASSDDEHVSEARGADQALLDLVHAAPAWPSFPGEGLWKNTATGSLHRAGVGPASACGFVFARQAIVRLSSWPETPAKCCGRHGCFPQGA